MPVEHRVLGLDRRTLRLAGFALAVWLLWAWAVPGINNAIALDNPVQAGEVVQVTPRVTMVPAVGWNLTSGLLTSDSTISGDTSAADGVVLVGDSVSLQVRPGPFTGTPAQLLDQINLITSTTEAREGFRIVGDRRTITTTSGLVGVSQGYQSARNIGIIAAFVADEGLQVQAVGDPTQMTAEADQIDTMINSLTYTPAAPR